MLLPRRRAPEQRRGVPLVRQEKAPRRLVERAVVVRPERGDHDRRRRAALREAREFGREMRGGHGAQRLRRADELAGRQEVAVFCFRQAARRQPVALGEDDEVRRVCRHRGANTAYVPRHPALRVVSTEDARLGRRAVVEDEAPERAVRAQVEAAVVLLDLGERARRPLSHVGLGREAQLARRRRDPGVEVLVQERADVPRGGAGRQRPLRRRDVDEELDGELPV